MPSHDSFLYEATRYLFSSLNPELALLAFFRHVRRHIPLREFDLNKTLMPFVRTMRVARVDEDGVSMIWTVLPISEKQRRLGESLIAGDRGPWNNMRMLGDEQDELYHYLLMSPGARFTPPMLFMRLLRDGQVIGSAIFQTFRPLTRDEQEMLGGLEPPLCIALDNLLQHKELADLKEQLAEDNQRLRRRLDYILKNELVGSNGGLRRVMNRVRMSAPVDVPVLITGETGVGKEVVAKAIHEMSNRRDKPFVVVNCGAIPSGLMDSELFGHTRGAFTGASSAHKGRFERADTGTLFLDEVGELPLEVQARLLRVLETREVEKVGGTVPVKVDIRIIAATHRNLAQMVNNGSFREDLYYRLRVVSIHVPSLRDRKQDIPDLVGFLLRRLAARYDVSPPEVEKSEMDALLRYSWPGNVRQLQNMLEEAMVCSGGKALHFTLPVESADKDAEDAASAGALPPNMDAAMREYLRRCLHAAYGRIEGPQGAARIAGISPSTFRFRCRKLGVER